MGSCGVFRLQAVDGGGRQLISMLRLLQIYLLKLESGLRVVKGSKDGRDCEFSESVLGEGAVVQRFVRESVWRGENSRTSGIMDVFVSVR